MEAPLLKKLQIENKLLKEDLNNLIPSVSGEGENVILNDTAEARFKKFVIKGNECKGSINIGVSNSLLKSNWAEDLLDRLNILPSDLNARILEINGHKYFQFPAGLGFNSGLNYFAKDCFKPNTQYTFKCLLMRSNDTLATNIAFKYTDGTYSHTELSNSANMTPIEYEFSSLENKTVETIEIGYQSGATFIDLDNCMLYEGIEERPLTLKTDKVNFPLQEGQVLHKGDYISDDGIHFGVENEEKVIPYSEAQKKAYNKLKNLKSFKNMTHIFSTDEVSPLFEVEAFKNIEK